MKTPPFRQALWPASISRPVATPLQPSVVYASDSPDALDAQYEGQTQGYTYAREGHPNADVVARLIDGMEGATGGLVLSSGMAAVSTLLLGALSAGDHVIGANQLYGRSLRLMTQELPRQGISYTLTDPTDAEAIRAALRPETRLILVETLSNPTLRLADLRGIAAVARAAGVPWAVDATFTTPAALQALDLGADYVLHSVTKFLAGHSDVTLGYLAARRAEDRQRLLDVAVSYGFTPSPFDCWLAERGLYTFEVRFAQAQATARKLADHLAGLPGVTQVLYPGREDHPDAARARDLLGDNMGHMVSFEVTGGRPAANALTRAMPQVNFAPTLGDLGTTLSHPASSSHRGLTPEGRSALGISEGFFRVSVGIEPADALLEAFQTGVAASQA